MTLVALTLLTWALCFAFLTLIEQRDNEGGNLTRRALLAVLITALVLALSLWMAG